MNKKLIQFIKNYLGNIEVKYLDGSEIEGFITHIETYLDTITAFNLYLDDEKILKAKNIFAFIRHNNLGEDFIEAIRDYIKSMFPKANLILKSQKEDIDLIIVDLFLYK